MNTGGRKQKIMSKILAVVLMSVPVLAVGCADCSNENIPATTIEKGTNNSRELMVQEKVDGSIVQSGYVRDYVGDSPSESHFYIYDGTGIEADMVVDFGRMAPAPVLQGETIGTIKPEEGGRIVKSGTTSERYGGDFTVVLDVYDIDLSFPIDDKTRVDIVGQIVVFPEDVTIPAHTECVE